MNGTQEVPERYSNLRRGSDSLTAETYAPLLRQGKGAYTWGSATLLRDSDGEIMGAIKTVKDFTEYKETQKQLEYLSMHDTLTGLYNRGYFDEEMSRLNNPRWVPVSIIICDLDNLKLVNDTLGHHQGDRLLKAAGAVIRTPFRSSDVIARIGGDEFALLLPKTGAGAAKEAADRIKKAVEHYNLSTPDFPLSLSIGHATGDLPVFNTFVEADNRMYQEKIKQSAEVKKSFISKLMSVLSSRKYFDEGHIERLQELSQLFARHLALSKKDTAALLLLARYRDLGMAAVPEHILQKPGKLTGAEFEEVKKHCDIGFRIAQASHELNHIAAHILHHHEWWNGEGYPSRLKGEDIPQLSRIQAILDAFEAMTSERPHRNAYTCDQALREIQKSSGTRFQPELVNTFVTVFEDSKIRSQFCPAG
jgi:diguanylate cyclase (GGDEF)-like protein